MRTLTSTTLASMMLASAFGLTLACGGSGGSDGGGGMGGSDESGGSSGLAGADSGGAASGGSASGGASSGGSAGEAATGGAATGGTTNGDFVDLPGLVRFANFISDGEAGIDVDVYFGSPIADREFFATVAYGTVSEFTVPRRAESIPSDIYQTNYFVMPAGATDFGDNLAFGDEPFEEGTQLTVALAATDLLVPVPGISIVSQTFEEHELSVPPTGFSHVYAWFNAWAPIDDFSFARVGADDLCEPEDGVVTGGNLSTPALIPEGATGVTLFDANTECASGVTPPSGDIEPGRSYVLMGEAETYELDQRSIVLLEVGAE